MSMEEQKKRRTRRKFTDEYKARAVRLVLKEGQTAAQVARDLDLIESVLHSWVRQAKIDRGMGPAGAVVSPFVWKFEDGAFSRVLSNPGTTPDRTGGMRPWRNVPGT